jgi:hypothetical protein
MAVVSGSRLALNVFGKYIIAQNVAPPVVNAQAHVIGRFRVLSSASRRIVFLTLSEFSDGTELLAHLLAQGDTAASSCR